MKRSSLAQLEKGERRVGNQFLASPASLADLKSKGLLSAEEFNARKAKILEDI